MKKYTKFLTNDYIVILKGSGRGFLENYIYKQREDCDFIRPYVDSKGSKANGWSACNFYTNERWRYATPQEKALYNRTLKPVHISNVLKLDLEKNYIGRTFRLRETNGIDKLYLIKSFSPVKVEITWGTSGSSIYLLEQLIAYIDDGTWVLQEEGVVRKEFPTEGYCMNISPELIRHIAKKLNDIVFLVPHPKYKGVVWTKNSYWFIQKSSSRDEYQWKYIQQFLNNKENDKTSELHYPLETKGQQREEGLYIRKRKQSITVSKRFAGNAQSIGRRKTKFEKSIVKGQPKLL